MMMLSSPAAAAASIIRQQQQHQQQLRCSSPQPPGDEEDSHIEQQLALWLLRTSRALRRHPGYRQRCLFLPRRESVAHPKSIKRRIGSVGRRSPEDVGKAANNAIRASGRRRRRPPFCKSTAHHRDHYDETCDPLSADPTPHDFTDIPPGALAALDPVLRASARRSKRVVQRLHETSVGRSYFNSTLLQTCLRYDGLYRSSLQTIINGVRLPTLSKACDALNLKRAVLPQLQEHSLLPLSRFFSLLGPPQLPIVARDDPTGELTQYFDARTDADTLAAAQRLPSLSPTPLWFSWCRHRWAMRRRRQATIMRLEASSADTRAAAGVPSHRPSQRAHHGEPPLYVTTWWYAEGAGYPVTEVGRRLTTVALQALVPGGASFSPHSRVEGSSTGSALVSPRLRNRRVLFPTPLMESSRSCPRMAQSLDPFGIASTTPLLLKMGQHIDGHASSQAHTSAADAATDPPQQLSFLSRLGRETYVASLEPQAPPVLPLCVEASYAVSSAPTRGHDLYAGPAALLHRRGGGTQKCGGLSLDPDAFDYSLHEDIIAKHYKQQDGREDAAGGVASTNIVGQEALKPSAAAHLEQCDHGKRVVEGSRSLSSSSSSSTSTLLNSGDYALLLSKLRDRAPHPLRDAAAAHHTVTTIEHSSHVRFVEERFRVEAVMCGGGGKENGGGPLQMTTPAVSSPSSLSGNATDSWTAKDSAPRHVPWCVSDTINWEVQHLTQLYQQHAIFLSGGTPRSGEGRDESRAFLDALQMQATLMQSARRDAVERLDAFETRFLEFRSAQLLRKEDKRGGEEEIAN